MGLTGQALAMSRLRSLACDCCGNEVEYESEDKIPENYWHILYGAGELWCNECWDKLETADPAVAWDKLQRLDDVVKLPETGQSPQL